MKIARRTKESVDWPVIKKEQDCYFSVPRNDLIDAVFESHSSSGEFRKLVD